MVTLSADDGGHIRARRNSIYTHFNRNKKMKKQLLKSAFSLLLLTTVCTLNARADITLEEAADQLVVGNPNAFWQLRVKTDRPDRKYKVGEKLSIEVSSEQKCYLQIINFAPDGEPRVLWPPKKEDDALIDANQTVCFPDPSYVPQMSFTAREPVGKELVVCLATKTKIDFHDPETKKLYSAFFDSIDKVSQSPLARLRSFVCTIEKKPEDWVANVLHLTTIVDNDD